MSIPASIGPYRLVRQLGHGGLGRVFEAVAYGASGFERRVAIKLLLAEAYAEPEQLRVLIAEGKNAGRLRHQNLVSVEQLEVDDGQYYVVMELIDGPDLARLLSETGPLPAPLVSEVGVGLARGLGYLHEGSEHRPSLVHRDVSPSNVLLSNHGEVKLTDFGIAKPLGRPDESSAHSLKGKLAYMSPEQARGDRLGPASDLFSLGCTLVELLTGTRPFEGSNAADTLERIKCALPPPLEGIDEALRSVLHDCLRQAPSARPSSAAEVERRLFDGLSGTSRAELAALAGMVQS
jgi:serine/threonine protein kinase